MADPTPLQHEASGFRLLFEGRPEALIVQDLEGRIVDVNQAALDLYGFEREELIGRTAVDITADLDRRTIQTRRELLEERGSLVVNSVGRRADGRTFPQEVTISIDELDGQPVAVLLVRDLSDRQRAEAGLAGLADLARLHGGGGTLAEVAGKAMNLARRMVDADRAALCAFHGEESVEWLASHRMEAFIAATVDLRPTEIPWLKRAVETGRPELIDRRAPQHVRTAVSAVADQLGIAAFAIVPLRSGDELTGALGLVWSGVPPDLARDEDLLGTIGRLIGLALGNIRLRDSLIARQRELDESEARYRALFQDAPEPILIESWDGRILDANRAASELYYRSRDDLIGRRVEDVAQLKREERVRVVQALRRDRRAVSRGRGIRADGTTFPQLVQIAVSSVRGEENLLVQLRDLTEQERMQGELLQAQKMEALGQLISGVAHELNNPLSAIVAFSQLMRIDERLPPELRRDSELLLQEADRTRRIVQNLLDFARQRPPERRATHLRELVERTLDLQSYALGTGRVTPLIELPDDLPPVNADPGQLQQVLLNLTLNAIQSITGARRPGTITISGRTVEDQTAGTRRVRVRITDNGPGVPAHVQARLFEPFFTTKDVGKGTGLGLSVSYGIVSTHGGRLWFEPSSEEGATFVLELPVAEPIATTAAGSRRRGGAGAAIAPGDGHQGADTVAPDRESRRRTGVILAVDDEPNIRELLDRALSRAGHDVTVAANGREALDILERLTFDLLLVDHRMSGMDGLELFERAVQVRPEVRNRTVVMSGDTLNPALREFAEANGLRMLSKPFDIAAVVKLVDEELAKAAAEDAEGETPEPDTAEPEAAEAAEAKAADA